MNIDNNTQSQFELFPDSRGKPVDVKRTNLLFRRLTLSLENSIVFCIILIMSFVVFFSFGVERGKRVAKLSTDKKIFNEGKKTVQVEKNSVLLPSSNMMDISGANEIKTTDGSPRVIGKNEQILKISQEIQETHGEVFTIQVASFKSEQYAKKEVQRLDWIGKDVFVLPKGDYSIVCVGRFFKKEEARAFSSKSKIKYKYKDFLIRRL